MGEEVENASQFFIREAIVLGPLILYDTIVPSPFLNENAPLVFELLTRLNLISML